MEKVVLQEVRVEDMTREDLKGFIKDVLSDEKDKLKDKPVTKEDVKTIVREMLKKYFRQMYTNSPFYLDKL